MQFKFVAKRMKTNDQKNAIWFGTFYMQNRMNKIIHKRIKTN